MDERRDGLADLLVERHLEETQTDHDRGVSDQRRFAFESALVHIDMLYNRTILLLVLCLSGCGSGDPAQRVVDRAIDVHGGDHLDRVVIEFDFREYHYTFRLDGGLFRYERARMDSVGYIRDVLHNDGFFREIDGERVALPDERAEAFASSVNSVAYFALLPFKLSDEAARKRHLGTETIDSEPYHEIEVTFRPEGGGRDYRDRFVYWIHREHYTMDYLAYDYVSDEGGTRFRKAVNPRSIGGLRFQDYENYRSETIDRPGDPIEDLNEEFEAGALELVSMIEKENVTVRPISE